MGSLELIETLKDKQGDGFIGGLWECSHIPEFQSRRRNVFGIKAAQNDGRFTSHLTFPPPHLLFTHPPLLLPCRMSASSPRLTQVELSWAVTASRSVPLPLAECDGELRVLLLSSQPPPPPHFVERQRLSVMSSSCQKRSTYFTFVQIWMIWKHLYPHCIFEMCI